MFQLVSQSDLVAVAVIVVVANVNDNLFVSGGLSNVWRGHIEFHSCLYTVHPSQHLLLVSHVFLLHQVGNMHVGPA